MSDYVNLGLFMRIVDVHWDSGRFLEREEYLGPLLASPSHFRTYQKAGDAGWYSEFVEGNCAVNGEDGMEYVPIPGLDHDRIDYPGYWQEDWNNGYVVGDWHEPSPPQWVVPWPSMVLRIPYNGFLRTRFVPYDLDDSGHPAGWVDWNRAASLSSPTMVYKDDIYYEVNNVSTKGAGNYVGMPMYLLRSGAGFVAATPPPNPLMDFHAAGRNIFIAKGAVKIKGEETTSEDIYQLKDFSEPYLTMGDVTTDTVDNCTKSLYVFDDSNRETMLAYNGSGGCTGKIPLAYAQICSIGGINLSFAATACINQPVYSNPEDLVITDLTIYTQAVTHA